MWINVDDWKPQTFASVLVVHVDSEGNKIQTEAQYDDEDYIWRDVLNDQKLKVTHWTLLHPLPID